MPGRLRTLLSGLRRDTRTLWLAARDRRTPWAARALAGLVLAYALSPIDLIPDFIPVLGHLDDLVLVPLGIWLALRMIPPEVVADARARAATARPPRSSWGAALVVLAWAGVLTLAIWLVWGG